MSGDGGVLVVCSRGGTASESTYRAVRVADGRELHRYDVKTSCRGLAIDAKGERYAVFEVGGWQLVDTRRGRRAQPFSAPKPELLTNLPLLGDEHDPLLVTWDDTAVTGTELGMDTSSVDSPPVLIDGGNKTLAHLGKRGESVGLLDTSEDLTGATGRLKILAEAKRDLATAPNPSQKLIVNAAETLVADRTARNKVMIRELPSLRRTTELTTAPPPPRRTGNPTGWSSCSSPTTSSSRSPAGGSSTGTPATADAFPSPSTSVPWDSRRTSNRSSSWTRTPSRTMCRSWSTVVRRCMPSTCERAGRPRRSACTSAMTSSTPYSTGADATRRRRPGLTW
ncbi:hypothetical protein ACFQ2B_38370 [Streptomyces stramineus]